jgi:hypothetical protein
MMLSYLHDVCSTVGCPPFSMMSNPKEYKKHGLAWLTPPKLGKSTDPRAFKSSRFPQVFKTWA